jgi:hypothetical protein
MNPDFTSLNGIGDNPSKVGPRRDLHTRDRNADVDKLHQLLKFALQQLNSQIEAFPTLDQSKTPRFRIVANDCQRRLVQRPSGKSSIKRQPLVTCKMLHYGTGLAGVIMSWRVSVN